MSILSDLQSRFPIRRSKAEKEAFRAFALDFAKQNGWEARVETTSRGKHQNVVIGDPEKAAVVMTAHYDTPANMGFPNLMIPRNIPLYILYQLLVISVLLLLGGCASALLRLVTSNNRLIRLGFLVVYIGFLCLMMFGPSNRHNANDNTSGVATLLEILTRIPPENRAACALILFDNEEKGCRGSKAYAKDHTQQQFMRLVVNLDCVGYGDHILLASSAMARKCTGFHTLLSCLEKIPGRAFHACDSRSTMGSSDHKSFKCGVHLMACRRVPLVGFVTPRIHTRHDTVCDESNLSLLADALSEYVFRLCGNV